MNTIFKFALASITILMSSILANAQDFNTEKFNEKLYEQRVKERVKLMNDFVSYMADKSNPQDNRYYYRKKALSLFIGKGYEYEENGIPKEGVMMQTTSVNHPGVITSSFLRDYFSRLVNLKYTNVNITSTEIAGMKVSALKKISSSDNKTLYMCTCQYVQYFIGEYGDGRLYKDKTTKRIACYVEEEKTEDGLELMILLGDVKAISTERL